MKKILHFFLPYILASVVTIMLVCCLVNLKWASAAVSASLKPANGSLVNLNVTTLEDELDNDGDCSLREAIQAANTNTSVDACNAGTLLTDTIDFSVQGMIYITYPITITAGGPLQIEAGGLVGIGSDLKCRLLVVTSAAELTIDAIFLDHGWVGLLQEGGAILNEGKLNVSNSNFYYNRAQNGGAVANYGSLTLNGDLFEDNDGLNGGAIYNYGALDVDQTIFYHNSGGSGGTIINSGSMTLTNSIVSSSEGIYGGAITSEGSLTLLQSTLSDNSAQQDGGAIYNIGYLQIVNSTLTGNSASSGGAINNVQPSSKVILTNNTIAANIATQGAGIYNNGIANATNTIIANNIGGDCYPAVTDLGNNLSSDESCGFDPAKGSLPGTNPLLEPLAGNGGATPTMALLLGSPAIDTGDPAACPLTDQRGLARPVDGDGDGIAGCDIGAYEYLALFRLLYLPMTVKAR